MEKSNLNEIGTEEFDFKKFMDNTRQDVFALARGLSKSRDMAIDITVETYKNFYNDYELPEKVSDKIYFYNKIVDTALRYAQKKDKKSALSLNNDEADEDSVKKGIGYINGTEDISEFILEIFDKMPYDLKQVMSLKNIAMLNISDISKILDISERQVSERLYFARRRIFDMIGKEF